MIGYSSISKCLILSHTIYHTFITDGISDGKIYNYVALLILNLIVPMRKKKSLKYLEMVKLGTYVIQSVATIHLHYWGDFSLRLTNETSTISRVVTSSISL